MTPVDGIMRPPGWRVGLPYAGEVLSNVDRVIEPSTATLTARAAVAGRLVVGGCWATHAAWDFEGIVWFDGGRWHETVSVHHEAVASYSAATLDELATVVNDEHGWG